MMDVERPLKEENILIVDETPDDLNRAGASIASYFPEANVATADSLETFKTNLESTEFDIVILDYELSKCASMVELIYQLKTENYEPAVVVVSKNPQARDITELYKFGCHRCIVKDDRWLEELGSAVDYLIRWRKAMCENLELRAKLTEANMLLLEKNQRLDEFSTTLAHDIRGPLGGIIMRLEYMKDSYANKLDEKFSEILIRTCDSTQRLTDLVQAMYEYAKLGAGSSDMKEVNLSNLIEEVLHDLQVADALDIKIGLGDLPTVWGNEGLLRRVFINFINNSIKYTDKEEIKINIGQNGIVEKALATYCTIFIEDNGAGIKAEDLEDIFSMFVRGTTAGKFGTGTGVGLAVVKRIIDLHHGEIQVESKVGQGTTFTLSLPLQRLDLLD
ncbi:ATP-binding protein [Oligoflexia bacterium]|nr:ATP-binding protein [Oligoflexia bacterium]